MVDWLIWYSDGSSFGSDEGLPEDAPRTGIEIIAQREDDSGRVMWWGHDFYWWLGHQWVGGDLIGLSDYLQASGKEKTVLFGRVMPYHEFRKLYEVALQDKRLPLKSTTLAQERRLPEEHPQGQIG